MKTLRMRVRVGAAWFAACCAWASPALGDGQRFTLIDDALSQTLISEPMGPTPGARGELVYSDARGVPRELPAAKAVALAPSWWADAQARTHADAVGGAGLGVLVLTDGQRLPGGLSVVEAPGESLAWEHPRLGRLVVPLERVSELVLPEPVAPRRTAGSDGVVDQDAGREAPSTSSAPLAPPPTDRSRDTVELANGDRLTGLVERIGADVVVSGAGAKATTVGVGSVRRVWLANPVGTPGGAMVWLSDGTVVGAKDLVIAPGEALRLGDWGTPGTPPASEGNVGQGAGGAGAAAYTVEDVSAIAFVPRRLRAIADLSVREQSGLDGRRLVQGVRVTDDAFRTRSLPAPLGARDIDLPAPMAVEFALPSGATRVSATLELPEVAWTWGDCRVRVEAVGGAGGGTGGGAGGGTPRVLLEARLNAESPSAKLAAAIPAGATGLRVSVDPGERGPVQDRVLVRRGLVLLGP